MLVLGTLLPSEDLASAMKSAEVGECRWSSSRKAQDVHGIVVLADNWSKSYLEVPYQGFPVLRPPTSRHQHRKSNCR